MANDALFEKLLTGNESSNQIVVTEDQEVGTVPVTTFFPHPFSKFSKPDKMGEPERIYLTWISNKALEVVL